MFQYNCDNFYAPHADGGISIKDDSLGIDWKIPTENALLSEKDMKHELLKDFDSSFSIDMDLYPEIRLDLGISGLREIGIFNNKQALGEKMGFGILAVLMVYG